jgi:lipopolysaccharide biosynthesis protein/SAM-dependent methyltransferase
LDFLKPLKLKNSPQAFNLENTGYVQGQGIYIIPGIQSSFSYFDGEQAENFLLESFQNSKDLSVGSEELQKYIHDWPSRYHLSPQRVDLLRPFADQLKKKKVLEIGSGCGAITRFLGELGCSVLALEGNLQRARIAFERCRGLENVTVVSDDFDNFLCTEKFDFAILIGILEYANTFMVNSDNGPLAMLKKAKEFLTDEGKLIIAIENKIGLKYWAGAPEDHIGKSYYNIQDLYSNKDAKTFGHFEIISLLEQAGLNVCRFMYPFPDYKFADIIITDAGFKKRGFNPLELLLEKFDYFQNTAYDSRFSSNLAAYSLFNNSLLPYFANSFLIMTAPSQTSHLEKENAILAYVYSTLRKKEYCKQTTFLPNSDSETISVTRQLLYKGNHKGSPHLQHLLQDEPYINGRILSSTILPIISSNGWTVKDIINWSRPFYDILISKSFDKDRQAWLAGKYVDLAPFNIILANGQLQFFDLEWICNEDIPAYYVFFRGLAHSLGRILFVNNPERGTPLQITQLALEVTKYYFQFDDDELRDCKRREMKYFSAVALSDVTEPFPLHELNVRNSDYLRLFETNTELSTQNETLLNELNRNRQQFDSEKIALLEEGKKKQEQFEIEKATLLDESKKKQAQLDGEKAALLDEAKEKEQQFNSERAVLLDEARKKEQQFDSERAVLLDEAKKKEQQFDSEKIALLNEVKKKQKQFDAENAALLDETTKKEAKLLDEIASLKKSIKWYADTYENRSIFGVLKEKIISKFKKKITSDTQQNERVSPASSENNFPNESDFFTDVLTIRHQADNLDPHDVCLFSSYSFAGKVEEYVFFYLAELKKAGLSIVFISTSPLPDSCVSRLSQYAFLIIERENKCPDFGSWKAGLSLLNWGKLNSLLLTNDSVFGPFVDLGTIISSMNNKYDVWGMTDNYEIDYHLQSYFLYFKKRAITSERFQNFWKNVDLSATKDEVIHKYEVGISKLFRDSEFRLGAYANIDVISKDSVHGRKVINPLLVFSRSLIKKHQFPFFKRELIIKRNISKAYDHLQFYVNVGGWRKVIKESTSYPISYIEDFMSNYHKVAKTTNSDIVLDKRKILFLSDTAEAGESQRLLINFLRWLKRETCIRAEILICHRGNNSHLATEFIKFGIVTNLYALCEEERTSLKKRLVDEISLVFSNTVKNLEAQKYLSFLDVPQIIYVHENDPTLKEVLSVDNNLQWVKENVEQLIASTDIVRKNAANYLGIDEKEIPLVNKFVTPYHTYNFEKEREKTRLSLHIPPGAFVVGMSGKLDWENLAELLPVISANLCKGNEDIHLVWLGADLNSSSYRTIRFDLERAAVLHRVHIIEEADNMAAFFALFDVFVVSSRENFLSLSVLENGLIGNPVIYFQDSQVSDEYARLGIGHSVPYLDIGALKEKILTYYNNRSQLKSEESLTTQVIKDNFTTDVLAPTLLQIINKYYDKEELILTEDPLLTFMTHIYYDNSWEEIRDKLKNFDNGKNYFLFSISEGCLIRNEIIENIKSTFNNAFFLMTPNVGRDIGGKMALIDLYLSLGIKSTYVVILHDKQSIHSLLGESWKKDLFKVIDLNNQNLVLNLFRDPTVGVVGVKDYVINEYNATTDAFRNNNQLSKKLLKQFGISIENYDFMGGCIFWIKASIIENFFTKNNPLLIRGNLEAGNVLDLYEERLTHTWERMFSWIAANEGYRVEGI